jgi:predicted lipid carrier protein YhbT
LKQIPPELVIFNMASILVAPVSLSPFEVLKRSLHARIIRNRHGQGLWGSDERRKDKQWIINNFVV